MNISLSTAYQGASNGLPFLGSSAADTNAFKAASASFRVCRQRLIDALQQDHPQPEQMAILQLQLIEANRHPHDCEVTTGPTANFQTAVAIKTTPPVKVRHFPADDGFQNGRLCARLFKADRRVVNNLSGFPSRDNFNALTLAFQTNGGMCRAEELTAQDTPSSGRGFVGLARLITSGQIMSLQWSGSYWIPMFQFENRDFSVREGVRRITLELADAFDDWEKAVWFVQPNAWLKGSPPLALIEKKLPEVLDAARADRFIAAG